MKDLSADKKLLISDLIKKFVSINILDLKSEQHFNHSLFCEKDTEPQESEDQSKSSSTNYYYYGNIGAFAVGSVGVQGTVFMTPRKKQFQKRKKVSFEQISYSKID